MRFGEWDGVAVVAVRVQLIAGMPRSDVKLSATDSHVDTITA